MQNPFYFRCFRVILTYVNVDEHNERATLWLSLNFPSVLQRRTGFLSISLSLFSPAQILMP
jgi:hypothetical protein